MRDRSSRLVDAGGWFGDGTMAVVSAAGVLRVGTGREDLLFEPFADPDSALAMPVVLADLEGDGTIEAIRGTRQGQVERCGRDLGCTALPAAGNPEEIVLPAIIDLVVGDFDHDGRPDIIAGRRLDLEPPTWMWSSRDDWQSPRPLVFEEGDLLIHAADLQAGDINGNGFPDLVAQVHEYISDFPSHTDVWLSTPTGFQLHQRLRNHDNHNDNAHLVDIDGDGCLDYLQIGVDIDTVGLRSGDCEYLGEHTAGASSDLPGHIGMDVGWQTIPARAGIGVQAVDVLGTGQLHLLIRGGHRHNSTAGLYFVPLP